MNCRRWKYGISWYTPNTSYSISDPPRTPSKHWRLWWNRTWNAQKTCEPRRRYMAHSCTSSGLVF